MSYDPDLAKQLNTVKARVEWILKTYPSTRNSDTMLEWIYLRRFENINLPYIEFDRLSKISIETVSRVRRKIQEEGMYLPTDPAVLIKRQKRENSFRGTINRL